MAWIYAAPGFASTHNLTKVDGERHGRLFFPLKELLVACGWTVRGSGDGAALYEYVGVTGGGGTGTGGAYDVWTQDTGAHDASAGNVSNALTWCVLRDPGGIHELLLIGTASTSAGYDAYGNIGWSHGALWVGAGVGATTPPAAAADEQWIYGDHTLGNGAELIDYTGGTKYIQISARNDPSEGGQYPFYWFVVDSAGVKKQFMAFLATRSSRAWDVAPYFFLTDPTSEYIKSWESYGLGAQRWITGVPAYYIEGNAFWHQGSNDDPVTGAVAVGEACLIGQNAVANQEYDRGVMEDRLIANVAADGAGTAAEYPSVTPADSDGMTWVHWNQSLLPWGLAADAPAAPLGGTPGTTVVEWFRFKDLAPPVTPGATVTYQNRVWNTTTSAWVRWDTVTTPDPLGASYPGPGVFGVDTQTPAHVEAVFVT